MEMRYDIQQAMERVPFLYRQMEGIFAELFGRAYGDVEAVQCDDADIVLVVSGTATGTCRQALSDLRSQGEKVGMLKIKMFRPFPDESIRRALNGAAKIAVVDRNCSFGAGGIFAQEIRSTLCNLEDGPPVFSYIAGLGGRDITGDTLEEIYYRTKALEQPDMQSVWIGLEPET
jgi:pyruvate/2-oxoacid:ferredoxin oxidoreductase alpha subunit